MRWVLKSKIHRATVTQADPDYAGSISIDKELIEMVGLWPNEKVLVASQKTGARLDTYVIEAEGGSGIIGMNGPAAHVIRAGEEVVIMGFELTDDLLTPKITVVDGQNRFVRFINEQ